MTLGSLLFCSLTLFYFLYTLSFAMYFRKAGDKVFSKRQKQINSVMIWLVPFLWIIIMKAMVNPKQKFYPEKKKSGAFTNLVTEAGWMYAFYSYFHVAASLSDSQDGNHTSEHNGGENDYHGHQDSVGSASPDGGD